MINERSLLIRIERFARALLVLLLLLAVGLYAFIAFSRISYPYELEWMEGASVDTVAQLMDGLPLYAAPTTDWVSPIYGPLAYYVSALFAAVFGVNFFALRLVSLLASFGCMILLGLWAKREAGSWLAGGIAVGVFAATFSASGGWFDLARVDTLFVLLMLASAYTLRFAESIRSLLIAGGLMGLSFLTKQPALIVALPLAVYALLTHGRRGLAFLAAFGLVAGGVSLMYDIASDGWYRYFVLGLGQQDGYVLERFFTFWSADLQNMHIALSIAVGYWLWLLSMKERRSAGFFAALLLGVLAAAYIARTRGGGFLNVLMPLHAVLVLMTALAFGALLRQHGGGRTIGAPLATAACIALCIQVVALIESPLPHIPDEQDQAAGSAFIETLRQQQGEVLVFAHGYYAAFADGGTTRLGWLMNIDGAQDEPSIQAFVAQMEADIARQRWAALVVDQAVFLSEDYQPIIEQYYEGIPFTFASEEAFLPVTGMETRPLLLYLPR
jgi:4-amino-4-deoxy-L-arabinose transferase-like glycosyltransferase